LRYRALSRRTTGVNNARQRIKPTTDNARSA
jgi:hypothetical protein